MVPINRKVLIISYLWPPMEGVGLIRAMKFAKYLPVYGWQPIILTVKSNTKPGSCDPTVLPGAQVFRTDYNDVMGGIKRLLWPAKRVCLCQAGQADVQSPNDKKARKPSLLRELILMPDDQIGWYKFGVEEGKRIITEEHVDAIFSTSPPETAHLIARRLKKDFGIPWIADLRDLWAEDHFRQRPAIKRMALRLMEKHILRDADAVVTVSEPWAEELRCSIGGASNKVKVIENAFDEEDFDQLAHASNDKLTIAYTGKLHRDRQPVGIMFKIVRDLVSSGRIDAKKIEIRFYALGYDKPDIKGIAKSYDLADIVKELGKISYEESLKAQRSADVLLFVQWQGRGNEGWYSAKLYDYIGSRRPILALAGKGSIVADLIQKTASGVVADTENGLRDALTNLYDEFIKRGELSYNGKEPEITRMSRKLRTGELAELLGVLANKSEA